MLADPCALRREHPSCVVLHELWDEFDVSVVDDKVLVAADRARVVGDEESVLRQSSLVQTSQATKWIKWTNLNTRSPSTLVSPSLCKVPSVPLPHLVWAVCLLVGRGLHIGHGELRVDEKWKLRKSPNVRHSDSMNENAFKCKPLREWPWSYPWGSSSLAPVPRPSPPSFSQKIWLQRRHSKMFGG